MDTKIFDFDISDYSQAVELWKTVDGVTLNESDTPEAISSFLVRNPGLSLAQSCAATMVEQVKFTIWRLPGRTAAKG
jgi:hypothetical protein